MREEGNYIENFDVESFANSKNGCLARIVCAALLSLFFYFKWCKNIGNTSNETSNIEAVVDKWTKEKNDTTSLYWRPSSDNQ